MKRFMMTTAVALLPFTAIAQTTNETGAFLAESDAMSIRASDFIGMRVYTTETEATEEEFAGVQDNWNDIGEINDVVMSRDGAIEAVLVDIGGFLGIGERQVAVDMDAIRFVSDSSTDDMENDFFLVMSAARADLENAPEYSWSNAADAAEGAMQETAEAAGAAAGAAAETATDVANATENAAAETAEAAESTAEEVADAATTGAAERTPMQREGYMVAERADLTTEMLTGARVYDTKDEWIGEVSTLIVGEDGTLNEAVIDVGGFLGIGEKPVALTMDKIDILREDGGNDIRVYVPMSKEELEALPVHEG